MFTARNQLFTNPSGYQITRSVRLRSSASAYFNRTLGAGGGTTKNVFSAWVKRGTLGTSQGIFQGRQDANNQQYISFTTSDTIEITIYSGAAYVLQKITTAVYRDPSAWYHIFFQQDTTLASAEDRFQLWVNGVRITSWATNTNSSVQNTAYYFGTANPHYIAAFGGSSTIDGYLAEVNFVYQPTTVPAVTSFGETDAVTGVWKPKKYTGTYGTNGFYLNFSDNSASTAATIGKDYSGNANNWTPNNISVTAGTTYDSMVDSPTVTTTSSNYAVLNPLDTNTTGTLRWGNLDSTGTSSATGVGSILITSGKWYAEATIVNRGGTTTAGTGFYIYTASGITRTGLNPAGTRRVDGVDGAALSAAIANNDVIGLALDADAKTLGVYLNGSLQGTLTFTDASPYTFNNDVRVSGATTNPDTAVNFGQQGFKYTPPTGYVALNTFNLPSSTINNGANYMAATLYTGNGTAVTVTNTVNGISFSPDFVWTKARGSTTGNHALANTIVGTGKVLCTDLTNAEISDVQTYTAFNSNGFSYGSEVSGNRNGNTMVSWQWKAGGASSSNTNGTITSTVSAGATQGFSVLTFTGTGAVGTIGHGLGVAPSMIIVKNRPTAGTSWVTYHASVGATKYLLLNTTDAATVGSAQWNDTAPTSTVFTMGNTSANTSGQSSVAYCFSEVAGYSKFGSYTGNGSADGPFLYLGFRPRWIMIKKTSAAGDSWYLKDTSRSPYNVGLESLLANTSGLEGAGESWDALSNGIKLRTTASGVNTSGATYIFMAFAENPFKLSLAR